MSVTTRLRAGVLAVISHIPGGRFVLELALRTVKVCLDNRVTGLAAEAGFFALLSLPPLLFGLLGGVGYLSGWLGTDTVNLLQDNIRDYGERFLTEQSLRDVLMPTLAKALATPRPDVISVGFLLSLWSGSRALNVLLDTVSIMYGQGGRRGIVRTRVLSLSLYFAAIVAGAIVVPLIVIGPGLLSDWLPGELRWLMVFYWPLVAGLTVAGFATLFYLSTPHRTPWVRDLPGAALTLAIWLLASVVLRYVLANSVAGASTSIYGPLAATIVVLIWLYFLGIAVLIGAAFNAATMQKWPVDTRDPVHIWVQQRIETSVARRRATADPAAPTEPVLLRRAAVRLPVVRRGPRPEPEDGSAGGPAGGVRADKAPEPAASRLDSSRAIG